MAETQPMEKTVEAVKYVGIADEVEITEAQWKSAGAEGQAKVEWNADNDHRVLASDLSKEALAVLEKDPARFKKVQVNA